MMQDFTD